MIPQEFALNKAFRGMSLNPQNDDGPRTPCTPSYLPFSLQSPSASPFPFRKYPGGVYTPSSLSSFSHETFDQNPIWSPHYNPFSEFPQRSAVWSPFSPGAIGQERNTPLLSRTHHERYVQQKRSQAQMVRRYNDNPSGHHNVVDIDRIRQGTDVRTTVGYSTSSVTVSGSHSMTDHASQHTEQD